MVLIPVVCPHCQTDQFVVKHGKTAPGKQRFLCRGYPNRTWNPEMGYGRINVLRALQMIS